jgi:hypothetical protein
MAGLQYIGQSGASDSGSSSPVPLTFPTGMTATGTTTPISCSMYPFVTARTVVGDYNLSGKITDTMTIPIDSDITSLNYGDMQANLGGITIPALPKLTSISAPNLVYVAALNTSTGFPSLTTLNFPLLEYSVGSFTISACPTLTTANFPALKSATINLGALGLIPTFPAMTDPRGVNLQPTFTGSTVTWNQMLRNWGTLTVASNTITSLTMSNLTLTDTILISSTTLSTLNLNSLARVESTSATTAISVTSVATSLVNFTLPATLKKVGGNVSLLGGALTQASVDNILARLAALDGTAGTTVFGSGRSVIIQGTASTPSATGLASKAVLVGRGVSVTHN